MPADDHPRRFEQIGGIRSRSRNDKRFELPDAHRIIVRISQKVLQSGCGLGKGLGFARIEQGCEKFGRITHLFHLQPEFVLRGRVAQKSCPPHLANLAIALFQFGRREFLAPGKMIEDSLSPPMRERLDE